MSDLSGGGFIGLFDSRIDALFKNIARTCLSNPGLARFFIETGMRQRRAARRRAEWRENGVHVPPLVIASLTSECNLTCKGCYAHAHCRRPEDELPLERWAEVFSEARDLGVSIIMLAGGEPLMRRRFLDVTAGLPGLIFPVFTNGLLIDDELLAALRGQRHVIPVLSMEGFEQDTDDRRGAGVYQRLRAAIDRVADRGIYFGVSLTATRTNFELITGDRFVKELVDAGCRLFIIVEYTPVEDDSQELVLTAEQKSSLERVKDDLQDRFPAVFIPFPGDEAPYGGCLAAGRGFVHIGPDGGLEPCPFAPYSDTSVRDRPLREALESTLLREIRKNHSRLTEAGGGCELWANRDWVRGLLASDNGTGPARVSPDRPGPQE